MDSCSRGHGSCVLLAGVLLAVAGGCSSGATRPAPELAQARAEYAKAAQGHAAQFAAADLAEAKAALDRAEALSRSQPMAPETRTQAYIALRRAQKAQADAEAKVAMMMRDEAARVALEGQAQQLASMRQELLETHARLEAAQARLQEVGTTQRQADERAAQALAALQALGQVHDEARGRVIAIPGTVLFTKGKAQLLPSAKGELDRVAQALHELPDRRVRIEGYTDTTGGDEVNGPLSEARAKAVRDYLVSRGADPSRVTWVGLGSSQPIADNSTEAGRAANRRVEIIIPPATGVTEQMPR